MKMRKSLLVLMLVLVLSALGFGQGQDDEIDLNESQATNPNVQDGTWAPKIGSPTAMREAGIDETEMYQIYTERIVLTSPLHIQSMKFYNYKAKTVLTTVNTKNCLKWEGKKCVEKERIVIKIGVVIRINPNDRTKGIVEGCLNEFILPIPFPRRIIVPIKEQENEVEEDYCLNEPELTVAEARADKEYIVKYDKKRKGYICLKRKPPVEKVVEDTPPAEVKDCPDCTLFKFSEAEFISKGWKAYAPSVKESFIAILDGAATSAGLSQEDRGKAAVIGGGGSFLKTVLYNVFTPDKNALNVVVNGSKYTVRKKAKQPVTVVSKGVTLKITWERNNHIYGRLADGSICFTAYTEDAFTVATMTVIFRRGGKKVETKIPVKVTPNSGSPVPVRPRIINGFYFTEETVDGQQNQLRQNDNSGDSSESKKSTKRRQNASEDNSIKAEEPCNGTRVQIGPDKFICQPN